MSLAALHQERASADACAGSAAVAWQVPSPNAGAAPARIALLGTGTVGRAVLARLAEWSNEPRAAGLDLVHVANSREVFLPASPGSAWCEGSAPLCRNTILRAFTPTPLPPGDGLHLARKALGTRGTRILIDATASDALAGRHAECLVQGIHVVTACKLGQGTSIARWDAIQSARLLGGAYYGDSATVGAGLPLLRTIRALRAGGDRIHTIAGVLSGSLGWLFGSYDGMRPFSALVHEARERGYTEPDPRQDLSGDDVRRKLLILARSAGYPLQADAVAVESLVSTALRLLPRAAAIDAFDLLDAPMRERYRHAHREGRRLRFIARLDAGGARVGLEALEPGDPLAQGDGCDNRIALWSDRYRVRPLVIQGPGAGAEVTAAALLDDVMEAVAHARSSGRHAGST